MFVCLSQTNQISATKNYIILTISDLNVVTPEAILAGELESVHSFPKKLIFTLVVNFISKRIFF